MFAPFVKLTRQILGTKKFNRLRAEIIKLHTHVITDVSSKLGLDHDRQMDLVHTARDNGKKLGLLA